MSSKFLTIRVRTELTQAEQEINQGQIIASAKVEQYL